MSRLPSPRIQGLIVRELAGELVVYDKTRHRAFCLNPTVASIWKSCEGRTRRARHADGWKPSWAGRCRTPWCRSAWISSGRRDSSRMP